MKLAHLADLHLGFRQFHRQTSTGLNQREADVANAFRAAVDGVIAERPDAVLLAGDIFHSVRPSNPSILFAFRELARLREALPDAPVILIAGNHDTPRSTETGSILALFTSLGVDVVADQARRLSYPALDLAVLAVPHPAWWAERVALGPEGSARHQVLMLHGEVEGLFSADRSSVEYGGALLPPAELAGAGWSYVALGHYHVQTEVAPRVWYSGSLEYVSTNPWGELVEERKRRLSGKGWLLVTLPEGRVERRPVAAARRVIDLRAGQRPRHDRRGARRRHRRTRSMPCPVASRARSCGWWCATCRATSAASWTTPPSAPASPKRFISSSICPGPRISGRLASARPVTGRRCPRSSRPICRGACSRARSTATPSSGAGVALIEAVEHDEAEA